MKHQDGIPGSSDADVKAGRNKSILIKNILSIFLLYNTLRDIAVIVEYKAMSTGEEKAWEDLNSLNPSDVCRKARVFYDKENSYILKSLGMDFSVHPGKREIKNIQPEGEIILKKYGYFFNLSALCYLINSKDIPLSGKLVKPAGLKGGEIFSGAATCFRLIRLLKGTAMISQALLKKAKTSMGIS